MNAPFDPGTDLSTLAWVHAELRRSLENAHKALRRHLKEAEAIGPSDVDAVDPSVLRSARVNLHQGVGALELVGLPAAAQVLRASEAAVQRMMAKPALVDAAAVEVIEKASFGLLDLLARMLSGKPVSPVALFPQYRAAQQLAGADRIHPADLWPHDWAWRDLPSAQGVVPRKADDAARETLETLMLRLMRQPDRATLEGTSQFCAELSAGSRGRLAVLWQLASAFFAAQAGALLASDVYTKRIASRLLAQLRMTSRGLTDVSERLAQDLLFFCAHARAPAPGSAPRLELVRTAWRTGESLAPDYETPRLGRFDPAWIAQARKRVATAKDAWSAVAGGELHRLPGLPEQFALVGDSIARLFPSGDTLQSALAAAASQTAASGAAPAAPLAMEVATSMLYLDASLEDGELDHPELAARVQRLAGRIDDVRGGSEQSPLESWMEELYRRVSDRQTMGSVVQELRASLSEVEKQIDQYFRNPAERAVLFPLPAQLSSMRGVLSVLGMDQASQAVLTMRDDVDRLAQTEVDPERAAAQGSFDRLADNLGALSFLIDMLSVQPQMAKSLFRFDPAGGVLSAVMGRGARESTFARLDEPVSEHAPLIDQVQALASQASGGEVSDAEVASRLDKLSQQALAAEQTDLARAMNAARAALQRAADDAAREQARDELARAVQRFAVPAPAAEPAPPPLPVPPPKPAAAGQTGLEDDAEMREIFVEEAREVIAEARASLARLADASDDVSEMTSVRRAFHTLKGSSRMVGLKDFGDAGWAGEQLYNARLATEPRVDAALRTFTEQALDYLAGWTEAIAASRDDGHRSADVVQAADALRLEGRAVQVGRPQPVAVVAAPVVEPVVPPAAVSIPVSAPEPVLDEPLPSFAEKTITLEAPFPWEEPPLPELPVVTETIEPAFALELPELVDRVPDLPAPGDLELRPPEPVIDVPTAEEVSFELDLGALDVSADVEVPAAEALPDETRAEPAPVPGELPELVDELPPALPVAAEMPLAIELDASDLSFDTAPAAEPEPLTEQLEDEQVKVIGPLRVSIPLFNIYLSEADEISRRLATELAEWGIEHEQRPVPDSAVALAHSLAGSSATVGYADLSALARALEHALMRSQAAGVGRADEPALFCDAADEIRRLLHQFAAGFLRAAPPELLDRLAEHERALVDAALTEVQPEPFAEAVPLAELAPEPIPQPMVEPVPEPAAEPESFAEAAFEAAPDLVVEPPAAPMAEHDLPVVAPIEGVTSFSPLPEPLVEAMPAVHARADAFDDEEDLEAVDAIDAELFPIFEEEAEELLPQLRGRLREWCDRPADRDAASACMRTLHTFKGGARLAGAMRLGELAHRLETAIEHLLAHDTVALADVEPLLARADHMAVAFEALRKGAPVEAPAPAAVPEIPAPAEPVAAVEPIEWPLEAPAPAGEPAQPAAVPAPLVPIDWARFARGGAVTAAQPERVSPGAAAVRVRAPLLDRLVNHAGEVSITRARIDAEMRQLQGALGELTDSLERMRRQLRDIELQAETQITSRMEAARAAQASFDPLEMDRFTRLQELTRFMAESVNDVATLQRSVQRTVQATEDELAAQARLTRELQEDLLRTRMVEFESLADRLYRVVRQAAKDTGKQVRLDIVGGAIEVDRGVLDRMVGPFEHLLRNSVVHGIEASEAREAAGKDRHGAIAITITQEGNEIGVDFRDDGSGLDLARIRERAVERGLVAADAVPGDAELAALIFTPGFSTATTVTELAGRGVGMDVVRAEVNAMGGRIETSSTPGQGTRFRLVLPLTTAVTQVVMMKAGETVIAVPATLIEIVRRVPAAEVTQAYGDGEITFAGQSVPFYWLGALLQGSPRGASTARAQPVVIVRSASQRVALHVDEVLGNQEVVVKNVGPQLARLPGLAGVTLLPSGAVALIYNPVALATIYGAEARAAAPAPEFVAPTLPAPAVEVRQPLVLVVDDSLTVRRVTQRLLEREGYRVAVAKDGMEALEKLAAERPAVMLSDIEMPRMDGFDLARNVRADAALASLPIVMITSRIAQKHRDYALQLGVDHYLGKPYAEDELLSLVARYARATVPA